VQCMPNLHPTAAVTVAQTDFKLRFRRRTVCLLVKLEGAVEVDVGCGSRPNITSYTRNPNVAFLAFPWVPFLL
jgi:hypothetical protein